MERSVLNAWAFVLFVAASAVSSDVTYAAGGGVADVSGIAAGTGSGRICSWTDSGYCYPLCNSPLCLYIGLEGLSLGPWKHYAQQSLVLYCMVN